MHVVPATHVVLPVQPVPPHCPYFATVVPDEVATTLLDVAVATLLDVVLGFPTTVVTTAEPEPLSQKNVGNGHEEEMKKETVLVEKQLKASEVGRGCITGQPTAKVLSA